MKHFLPLIFIVSLLSFSAHAQLPANRDSLLKLLPAAKEDTSKVILLYRLAKSYEMSNQDSATFYLQKCRELSETLQFTKGKYLFYERSAVVSFTKGNYARAMDESNKGLIVARELKDSSYVITMLNNIAITYGYLEKYNEQLDYTLQVKKAIEALKDSSKMSGLYHNLSNCYFNIAQYRKSADCALLSIYFKDSLHTRNDYINRVYAALAKAYEQLHQADSAIFFYNKAVTTSIDINDKYAEITIYMYLCNLYANLGRFPPMLKLADKSLVLARELQSSQSIASAFYSVAAANFYNGNNSEARKNIDSSIAVAKKDSLADDLQNGYTLLAFIAARGGDFATSVYAKTMSDSIKEAALNEKIISSTTELEKKYETEKKDAQLKLQQVEIQRRSIYNYIFISSAIIILIISLLSYRTYQQKQKLQQQRINELETEKKLTATEAVLKGEEQERTRLAKDLHDGLGGMLSGIKYSFQTMKGNLIMTPENAQAFERSMDMLDSSIKEMRRVAHNMMPEALVKFGLDTALKDFCSDINQSGALKISYQSIGLEHIELEQITAITVYRIVQELINNTMKHAAATTAIVQVSKSNGVLSVTVEDDGKGFDTAFLHQAKGIGWDNIQNRVEFLKGRLDVKSEQGKGTSVMIEIQS